MDYLSYKAVKLDGKVGLLTNSAVTVVRMLKGFVNYQMAKCVIPHIDSVNGSLTLSNVKCMSPAAFMRYIKFDNKQAADRLKELRAQMKR